MLPWESFKVRHPMQPLEKDKGGTIRFKTNKIVNYLLDQKGGIDLNYLAARSDKFDQTDWEQFYQLIGYSIDGFHELSFVSDATAMEATRKAQWTYGEERGCRAQKCEIHIGVERT